MKQKIFNRVKFKKYIFIFLTLIFILNITPVLADEPVEGFEDGCKSGLFGGGDVCYKSEIAIPGFPDYEFKVKSTTLGLYIKALYEYLLYVAGVLAVIVIMVGGFQWITAGGNQSKIGEAKERVMGAVIGLFLALGSYLLLYTINPDLVKIHDLNMPSIEAISIYCQEGQSVIPSSPIDADKAESMGIIDVLNNQANNGVDGTQAFCGFSYDYQIEDVSFKCTGTKCKDSTETCVDGECLATAPENACTPINSSCTVTATGEEGFCSGHYQCILCKPLGASCTQTIQCCQEGVGVFCRVRGGRQCTEGATPY